MTTRRPALGWARERVRRFVALLIPSIRLPIAVVDAGAHQYFIEEQQNPDFIARRQMLTLGSVRYTFTLAGNEIAIVTLRSVGDKLTNVEWKDAESTRALPTEIRHQIEDLIRQRFWDFKAWIEQNVQGIESSIEDFEKYIAGIVDRLITVEDVAEQLKTATGRPTYEEDLWAWEQVNIRKQPKSLVRREWEQRVDDNKNRILEKGSRPRTFSRITSPNWPPAKKQR